jgi:hypothetical protein
MRGLVPMRQDSYVEIKVSWPCLHKTLSGAGRWNRANFAFTEFYEVSSTWGCTPHTARYLADRVLLATEGV